MFCLALNYDCRPEKNGRFFEEKNYMQCPFRSMLYAHDISVLDSFSASQDRSVHRAPAAHTAPAAARRNPGPGCRVSGRGPATTGAPERRKMRGYTLCRGGVYADQLTPSRSASDDAFSVANNHRQINRYIVDSILQYI